MKLRYFLALFFILATATSAFAHDRYGRNRYRDRYQPHDPYYYKPGMPIPPLFNPWVPQYRGHLVCYAQSPTGHVFWGSGVNVDQANFNAHRECQYSTGYYCFNAGCRVVY